MVSGIFADGDKVVALHQVEFFELIGPLNVTDTLDLFLAYFVVVQLSHSQNLT